MADKIEIQGWAFVLTPRDHLRILAGEIKYEDMLLWDQVKGFIGIGMVDIKLSYHIFLTREAMHEGAEMARKSGFAPFEMSVPVPVDEDMMQRVAHRDD